jgi:hypothetical protein
MTECDWCGRELAEKADYCTLIVHRSNQNVLFPIPYCDVSCLIADWKDSGDVDVEVKQ